MSFVEACKKNDIEWAKTCPIPDKQTLNQLFIHAFFCCNLEIIQYIYGQGVDLDHESFTSACCRGNLDIVKWRYSLGVDICDDDNRAFAHACTGGHLDVAKWLYSVGASIFTEDNVAFIYACSNGHLDVAQWLYSLGADIHRNSDAFIYSCENGHLNVAQWLYSLNVYLHPDAFIDACRNGQLAVAQWLYNLGIDISAQNDQAFKYACQEDKIEIIEWLLDIHYNRSSYIEFDQYTDLKDEIKNILIDNNLVNPSELSLNDLKYYLARTDNVVPSDFILKYDNVEVKYRGKHTKQALRE